MKMFRRIKDRGLKWYHRNENKIKLILAFSLCMTLLLYMRSVIYENFEFTDDMLRVSFIFAAFMVTGILAFTTNITQKKNKEKDEKKGYREYLIDELEKDEQKQENLNILSLMLKNNDETKEYFTISKTQAKYSYNFSVTSCVIGFIMLAIAMYGVFIIKNYQFGIIITVSGAVTEVIAGTVLVIQNKTALQLNYYYNALHQNEKFLSAVKLADMLSDEKREEMYIEIIRKQMEMQDRSE